MEVFVNNKKRFDKLMEFNSINDETVHKFPDIMFISIVDSDQFSKSREPWFKSDHPNVMNLAFDDCEHDGQPSPTQPSGTKAFSEEQASKLFKFIDDNRNVETFIVHCMAGISRSGAVGTFINGYCGGDWDEFKRTNPQVVPNARVSRLLNRARYKATEK